MSIKFFVTKTVIGGIIQMLNTLISQCRHTCGTRFSHSMAQTLAGTNSVYINPHMTPVNTLLYWIRNIRKSKNFRMTRIYDRLCRFSKMTIASIILFLHRVSFFAIRSHRNNMLFINHYAPKGVFIICRSISDLSSLFQHRIIKLGQLQNITPFQPYNNIIT